MERVLTRSGSSRMWDSIWTDRQRDIDDWDYLSEVVFQVLREEVGEFKNKRIIETGSGSGRISLKMAELSASVTLLDYSIKALDMSRNRFYNKGLTANFIQADIIDVSLEDNSYDIAWNAGVLEHFMRDKQSEVLKKLLRAVKEGGKLITINPSAKSMLYKFGKGLLIILKRWPFGREYPVCSIRDIYKDVDKEFYLNEYSVGFIVFFVDTYKFLPKKIQQAKIVKKISGLFIGSAGSLSMIDRFLSRIFGGYLVVSVITKRGRQSEHQA